MPKEVFGHNEPVFKHQLLPGLTREVYIAPETCQAKHLSMWIVRASKPKEQPEGQPKEQPKEEMYDVHEGMEEAYYVIKGRVRLITPNESVVLEQGGCGWIPAGMPHTAAPVTEDIADEIVVLCIFGPARSAKAKMQPTTAEEANKIAEKLTR
ncbi:MAG: cupin domain-containing protein [Candidatus Bathyarchaeota archaeon]|nr:cupin domain-containing protein [Candidatus Bathyarchaeota archaeon]